MRKVGALTNTRKYSYSIKDVRVPEGEWLTLLEGAAYARTNYARFTHLVKVGDIPSYTEPGAKRRKVRKRDIDAWLMTSPA